MTNITDFVSKSAPFENEFGVTADQYTPINSLLNKPLKIKAVKVFTNDKGAGVSCLVEDNGILKYFVTHAATLVGILSRADVLYALENGEVFDGTIIERKSKTSNRNVYAFAE